MRRFKMDNWVSYQIRREKLKLNNFPSVYLIVILKKGGRRKIVYIGNTLKKNLKGYLIEIWYKDFGDFPTNYKTENDLIFELKPVFNTSCTMGKLPKKIASFWKRLGVHELIGSFKQTYSIGNSI